jgi:sucrose 6(F)-phosphate phosphorylase
MHARGVPPRPQLLTYPDSLGGNLAAIGELLDGPLDGLFHGVHVLPPFPSSGDRGFAPLTHFEIEPRFGSWADIKHLSERHDVLLDLIVNHVSRQSAEFRDFERHGRASSFADLFITLDKVWPDGDPPASDVARIFLRKPNAPFSSIRIEATGESERVWTSFGSADWSEQIDLDIRSDATHALIRRWLGGFAEHGVRIVRLDAVGYVIKQPGTSCFMVEPAIYDFLGWITEVAAEYGLVVLPEVHDRYSTHERLSAHGFWTYDFVLPGLVLHAFETGETRRLASHLANAPSRQFTTLDCHDGIPIRPDLDGILEPGEMRDLADLVERRGGNVNRILSGAHADEVDVHQLNGTFRSSLGGDDERYLAARAIQLFAKGVPQVYYVGLLAGFNDLAAVARSGEGRAVNRHDYTRAEIDEALARPVVVRLLELIRLRNTHPAFDGTLTVVDGPDGALRLAWRKDEASCELEVNVRTGTFAISTGQPLRGSTGVSEQG